VLYTLSTPELGLLGFGLSDHKTLKEDIMVLELVRSEFLLKRQVDMAFCSLGLNALMHW
jgi:hypothetical protein